MVAKPTANIGFDFSGVARNAHLDALSAQGKLKLPKATSTGTTIVGCLFADGIVLGADTRSTLGPIIADKNCEKIHYISENIRCAGAGTAADTEFTSALIASNMQLHSLSTGRPPRVVTALTQLKQMLFRYRGNIGAALVLGGYDSTGPHLYSIHPHGSTDKLPYVTMGSGSLAAMAFFEARWAPNLSKAEAIELVVSAIEAGIFNDLGSGSNVDVAIIEKDKTEMLRNYRKPNERALKEASYIPRSGATAVTKEMVWQLVTSTEIIAAPVAGTESGAQAMEVDT